MAALRGRPRWLDAGGALLVGALLLGVAAPRDAGAETARAGGGAKASPATITICGTAAQLDAKELSLYSGSPDAPCGATFAGLARLSKLESLSLQGDEVTDGTLSLLRGHRTLRHLALHGTSISNGALVHVGTMSELRWLEMDGNAGLTGAGLAHLATLARLERLALSRGQATDIGAAHLAAMKALKTVETPRGEDERQSCDDELSLCSGIDGCYDLAEGAVTDRGLARLVDLPIVHLLLDRAAVTDRTIALIARMKQLRTLNWPDSENYGDRRIDGGFDLGTAFVTAAGIRKLAGTKVRHLRVEPSRIDRRLLEAISSLPGLSSLNCAEEVSERPCEGFDHGWVVEDHCIDLSYTKLSSAELALIGRLPGTRSVVLPEGFELTGAGAAVLFSLPSLERLNSSEDGVFDLRKIQIDDTVLAELHRARHLETLYLDALPPGAAVALGRVPSLGELIVEGTKVTAAETEALLGVAGLRGLDVPPAAISRKALALALAHPELRSLGYGPETCRRECFDRQRSCVCDDRDCLLEAQRDCADRCVVPRDERVLDLRGTGLGARDLGALKRSTSGARLFLDGVTNATLGWAASLPRLVALNCPEPRCVDLTGGKVTAAALNHIGKLADLERLTIPPEVLSDKALAVIGALSSLASLNRPGWDEGFDLTGPNAISPVGLRKLSGLPRVEVVAMNRADVTDAAIAVLATFPGLVSMNCPEEHELVGCIDLEGTRVTAAGVRKLSRFAKARNFLVPPGIVDDTALASIVSAPGFESLNCEAECQGCCQTPAPCLSSACVDLASMAVTARGLGALRAAPLKQVHVGAFREEQVAKALPGVEVVLSWRCSYPESGEPTCSER